MKPGRHDDGSGGGALSIDSCEEHGGGGVRLISLGILRHDRETGVQQIGQHDVVETHVRDPIAQPGAPQGPQGTDCDEVLAGEQGRRRIGEHENGSRLDFSLLDGGQVVTDECVRNPDTGRPECRDVSGVPVPRRADVGPVAQIGDTSMTGGDQVIDRADGACVVI